MFLHNKFKEMRENSRTRDQFMIDMASAGSRVSIPTITKWETGESTPDADHLEALAKIFDKPMSYFFGNNK